VSNEIVKRVNTEKTHKMLDDNVYVFLFQKNIRKHEIKSIVEKKYSVKVDSVNVVNIPKKIKSFRGTVGVLSRYKKAYIKVTRGMKIEVEDNNKGK